MAIYFVLLGYILVMPLIVNSAVKDKSKVHGATTFWSIFGIYWVFALKHYTVGIDIPGYRQAYILSQNASWDSGYAHFEKGYVFLEKLFSKSGASFQVFTMFIYFVICLGLYLFIKKYSKNAMLSCLFFVCYQYLLFSMTGLRQAMAMGMCLTAYVVLDTPKEKGADVKLLRGIAAITIVQFAISIHESAAIFYVVIFAYIITYSVKGEKMVKTPPYILYAFVFVVLWMFRSYIIKLINAIFKYSKTSNINLGTNFYFLIIVAIFILVADMVEKKYSKNAVKGDFIERTELELSTRFFIHMAFLTLPIYLVLSGSTIHRGSMYPMFFYMVSLPNAIEKFNKAEKYLITAVLIIFFILFFYYDALKPGTYYIVPYKFFWQ